MNTDAHGIDWVFQTGCFAPGSTRNEWGTSRPCLLPPTAAKSKPPALRVVVDSQNENIYTLCPPKRSNHFGMTALL